MKTRGFVLRLVSESHSIILQADLQNYNIRATSSATRARVGAQSG